MIDRDTTTWRQGSLLKGDELHAIDVDPALFVALVITHDCDIGNPAEGMIEIIVASRLARMENNFCNARNIRKLHLTYAHDEAQVMCELTFQNRVVLRREDFEQKFSGPDDSYRISDFDKRVLKQWLSVRYGRPAYPNAFERRLRVEIARKISVERKLLNLITPKQSYLVGVWIDLDTDKNIELPPEDSYFLKMYLVYYVSDNLQNAREQAEELAQEITALFESAYAGDENKIILDECRAVAENRFSLLDVMRTDQWRVEHLSLSANDESFVETGS